jgi:GNAT superfamily N-acetyltransferase
MIDYQFVSPTTPGQWSAYHDIRRTVLWESRGQFGVYDENHPDETAAGHHPKLLVYREEPVGVARIDVAGPTAILRRVAVRGDLQRHGHGRALLSFAEQFARTHGCSDLTSHVAQDAVEFYRKCGYAVSKGTAGTPPTTGSVLMNKQL